MLPNVTVNVKQAPLHIVTFCNTRWTYDWQLL